MQERRRQQRRKMGFYFRVFDADTQHLVGHLTDVSLQGINLDCSKTMATGATMNLSIETTPDISDTEFIYFVGQVKWCRMDTIVPNVYNAGIQITSIGQHDATVLKRVVEHYGS
ncbi:MAG: PilZ domain-containing protein [Chloroflexi bacterium]|nr:PilZ domain-containing protein [Chloroflexota bacterium]